FSILSPLHYLLPANIGYGLLIILQFVLAGWFLFLFCELLGLSRPASLLAGIAFMWNGFFLHWFGVVAVVGTLLWMPLLTYFTYRLFLRNDWRSFHGLTFAVLAQFLGGHSQSWIYNMILLCLFWLLLLGRLTREHRPIIG